MSGSGASAAFAALTAAAAIGFAAGCNPTTSNNCGNGAQPPSLIGTFALLSYTQGSTTTSAPPATGNLRYHAFTYGIDALIPSGAGNTIISDSGNYNIVGSTCVQRFSVLGNPDFSGSFLLNTDSTYHESGSAGGQISASLWKRTS
jgi:hypothetical protein